MPWSDYGFNGANGLDMALAPIGLTLNGLIKAAKERLDVINVSDTMYNRYANGYYTFYPDNFRAFTVGGDTNRAYVVDTMLGSIVAGGTNPLGLGDNGFITSDSYTLPVFDYSYGHMTTIYDIRYVLDKACEKLENQGFQTVKVPFGTNYEMLTYDKHWLIQRKTIADMLRYYYVSYEDVDLIPWNASNLGDIIVKYKKNEINEYYSSFSDALSNAKTLYEDLSGPTGNIMTIFDFDYYNGQNNIRYLIEEFYVNKETIDTIGSQNVRIRMGRYHEADGVMPIIDMRESVDAIFLSLDFTNPIYLPQYEKTYYKIKFPLTPSAIADYAAPYWGYNNDDAGVSMYIHDYPKAVYDGANTFDLIDT